MFDEVEYKGGRERRAIRHYSSLFAVQKPNLRGRQLCSAIKHHIPHFGHRQTLLTDFSQDITQTQFMYCQWQIEITPLNLVSEGNTELTLIRPNAQIRPATSARSINFPTVKHSYLWDPWDGADLAVIVGLGGFKSVKLEFGIGLKVLNANLAYWF